MKTVNDLKKAFVVYDTEMNRCEAAGAYWALLHLAIVMPDICAALEDPTAGVSTRYVDWCKAYFPPNPSVTAGDRFQMRNALLHQGTTLPTNRGGHAHQHTQYRSFSFVGPGAAGVVVHQNISPDGTNLTIDVKELAEETRNAMEKWFKAVERDAGLNAKVEGNLSKLAREQQKRSVVSVSTSKGIVTSTQFHTTTSST